MLPTQRFMIQLLPPEMDVVQAIRRQGPLARSEVADFLGYSRSTMTSVVNNLIEAGILVEMGAGESTGGRRPRALDFNPSLGYVVGVDMGATSVTIALADFRGAILDETTFPIDVRERPQAVLPQIQAWVLSALEGQNIPVDKVRSFGIGVPGPVEFTTGLLIAPPLMPTWEAFPIRDFFQETFPNALVVVDNDVNVMALGELRLGAGQNERNFLFIKVGTGIGCGIVAERHIYRGVNGSAGDVGHICVDRHGPTCHCGNIGCLEAMAGGRAIAHRAMDIARSGENTLLTKILIERGTLTAADVGAAAAAGDRIANEIIQDSGRMIGEVLASLVNFFNPSLILIGGGVSKIGHQFLASIRRAVLKRSLPLSTQHLRIDTSPLGETAGVKGAIMLAFDHIFVSVTP